MDNGGKDIKNSGQKSKKLNKSAARRTAADIAECAIFAALMAAGAFIQIPFPFVPLTFQTAVSILAGLLLGAKKGAASIAVYAFMGLAGLPVFTSGGGFSYVLKPSFGYIIGFIAAAFVAGLITGRNLPCKLTRCFAAAISALAVNYIFGIFYFIVIWQVNGYEGLWRALFIYNIVYIPKDAVLSVISAIAAWHLLPVIRKRKKLNDK